MRGTRCSNIHPSARTAAHLSPQSLLLLLDCGQVGHQLAVVALLMLQLQTEARMDASANRWGERFAGPLSFLCEIMRQQQLHSMVMQLQAGRQTKWIGMWGRQAEVPSSGCLHAKGTHKCEQLLMYSLIHVLWAGLTTCSCGTYLYLEVLDDLLAPLLYPPRALAVSDAPLDLQSRVLIGCWGATGGLQVRVGRPPPLSSPLLCTETTAPAAKQEALLPAAALAPQFSTTILVRKAAAAADSHWLLLQQQRQQGSQSAHLHANLPSTTALNKPGKLIAASRDWCSPYDVPPLSGWASLDPHCR